MIHDLYDKMSRTINYNLINYRYGFNSNLLEYFEIISPVDETKPFSFFIGKKLTLREIYGLIGVLQLVDRNYNMLEMKMIPDIDGILRRQKLGHIKKKINS